MLDKRTADTREFVHVHRDHGIVSEEEVKPCGILRIGKVHPRFSTLGRMGQRETSENRRLPKDSPDVRCRLSPKPRGIRCSLVGRRQNRGWHFRSLLCATDGKQQKEEGGKYPPPALSVAISVKHRKRRSFSAVFEGVFRPAGQSCTQSKP